MDLVIDRDLLIRGLQRVQGIVERRTTNLALAHVLLTARGDRLRMTATDTLVTLVADYPANIRAENELCVEAQHLFQIARSLSEPVVSLTLSGASRLQVKCGRSVFHLNTIGPEDFPPLAPRDEKKILRVRGADLRRLIEETLFSISADDNRYGLNGAHLEEITRPDGERRVRMCTTDGSRLSYSEAAFSGEVGMGRKVLLPRKALGEVRKLCEEAETSWEVSFGERSATFQGLDVTLTARLVDGEFPDYRQVLPEVFRRKVEVDRAEFTDALRRVSLVATDRNHSVRFSFQADGMLLSAENVDLGDAREEIAANLEGEPMTTGFNIKYFQDLLGPTQSDRLSLKMGDVLDPCIVELSGRDDCLFIVMPMRLD